VAGDAVACRLVAGLVAELVDGGVGASAAGFGGAVAGVGSGLALAAVIDHALDDGLAKAHDIIVVDGGSGCEEALIIDFIRTPPTFIRTCADECGNPIP